MVLSPEDLPGSVFESVVYDYPSQMELQVYCHRISGVFCGIDGHILLRRVPDQDQRVTNQQTEQGIF